MSLLSELHLETNETSGFVYSARRPFHPQRFCGLLQQTWPGVSRIKGFVWIASCMETVAQWAWADGICSVSPAGRWWAARPDSDWPASLAVQAEIRRGWHPDHGDRRQEIVFLGSEMDRKEITSCLDAILLTDAEMGEGVETGWMWLSDAPNEN